MAVDVYGNIKGFKRIVKGFRPWQKDASVQ